MKKIRNMLLICGFVLILIKQGFWAVPHFIGAYLLRDKSLTECD